MKKQITQHLSSKRNTIRYQAGLTLIELMIAMVIGLFLLLSISSVYLANLKSSTTRNQYSLLEDNARLALDSMTKVIEHTGYEGRANMFSGKFITGVVDNNACVTNDLLFKNNFGATKNDDTGAAFTGDRIGVVHIASSQAVAGPLALNSDCTGTVAQNSCQFGHASFGNKDTADSRIFNAFYIKNNGNDGKLMCIGSVGAGEELIADNIENMQITYGIDTDSDQIVNQYVDAGNINGAWDSVISVQIAILVKSDKEVKDVAEQKTYDLLGVKITAPQGSNKKDRFQRAVFSTTISLRNI